MSTYVPGYATGKIKVYGGRFTDRGQTVRAVMAARSKKRVAERVSGIDRSVTRNEVAVYWTETRNETEIKLATARLEVLFIEWPPYSGKYEERK